MSYKQTKNTVRKKDGTIIVGDVGTEIIVEGKINAQGNLNIKYPFVSPTNSPNEVRVLFTDGYSYEWRKEKIKSYVSLDASPGLDYVYVNATRGFVGGDQVVLNPWGNTRETGVISYALETKVYFEQDINNPHYVGETMIKI